MPGRILSLFTALMLACAPASAYAPERSIASPELRASAPKTASRDFEPAAEQSAKKNPAASACRVWEIWLPPLKLASSMGFTGYYADAESGQYYAQQRYYRQGVGRFLSVDPWEGDTLNPVTLNKYLYANGNPLTYIDPTGKYAEAGHYYTTHYLALEAGYTNDVAIEMALYSQLPDEVGAYDAINQVTTGARRMLADVADPTPYNLLSKSFGIEPQHPRFGIASVQCGVHALCGDSGELASKLAARDVVQATDHRAAGVLLHRLGDTVSHRGMIFEETTYIYPIGHGYAGKTPDMTHKRPGLYEEHIRNVYSALYERKNGRPPTREQVEDVTNRLFSDVHLSHRAAIAEHKADLSGFVARSREAMPTNGLFWPPPSEQELRESAARLIPSVDSRVEQLLIERLAKRIERKSGVPLQIRPERAESGAWSGPGDETNDLRNFYAMQGVFLDDAALEQKARQLEKAVERSIHVSTEGADGNVKVERQ